MARIAADKITLTDQKGLAVARPEGPNRIRLHGQRQLFDNLKISNAEPVKETEKQLEASSMRCRARRVDLMSFRCQSSV